jgi:NTE family protein
MDSTPRTSVPAASCCRPEGCGCVALVLQGGGALGAYQAGVYDAMEEAGLHPDWVAGVSIGAINTALIAGNPPGRRVERLRAFWERVTARGVWPVPTPDGDDWRRARNLQSAFSTLLLGQPGFFRPNPMVPWLVPRGGRGATAFYDTSPLRETLEELVDWRLLNGGHPRVAFGAVNAETGNLFWFDCAKMVIGPEHVMASGALPPGFAPVRVGTDWFWDGIVKLLSLGQASWRIAAVAERQSSRCSNPADIGPHLERTRPCGSMFSGGDVVAAEMEKVGDLVVGREEALCLPR